MSQQPVPITPIGISVSIHEKLLDSMHDGVYFVNTERKIVYWNQGAELLTGYRADEVVGKYCFDDLLAHVNDGGCALCLNGCPLAATLLDGQRREFEVYLRHKAGHRIPVSTRVAPVTDDSGAVVGAVEIFSDATAKKTIERRVGELENLAFLDELTGVSNRRFAELKVKQALQEVQLFDRSIGLLMLDIDHFKLVNDKHGHDAGDEALRAVCKTVSHHLRAGDILGRWGGEEFVLILRDVNEAGLSVFADRCRMLISETSVPMGAEYLRVTVSVGATIIQKDDNLNSVMHRVDTLMYKSKTSGRNCVTTG
jgi:diguanylate cyclase (GGDEF)-like protein/PAS domain S-box-containing protein